MAPGHCQARTDSGLSPVFDGRLKRSPLPSVAFVSVYVVSQPISRCSKIMCLLWNSAPWLLKCKIFHECNWSSVI